MIQLAVILGSMLSGFGVGIAAFMIATRILGPGEEGTPKKLFLSLALAAGAIVLLGVFFTLIRM